jgi:hypothetical protein
LLPSSNVRCSMARKQTTASQQQLLEAIRKHNLAKQ